MHPMTLVRSDSPQVSGFWARDMTTGQLEYVDTCPEHGGIVSTVLPRVDSHHRYIRERASDLTLNATVENLHHIWRTLRGTGKELFSPDPAAFWDRVFGSWKVSGGSPEFTVFAGVDHGNDFTTPSRGGLVIDESTPMLSIDGFPPSGNGPGGGGNNSGGNSTGGAAGYGTAGGSGGSDGQAVNALHTLLALVEGVFDRDTLSMGGSGGSGRNGNTFDSGGSGGDGIIHRSSSDIVDSATRDLSGVLGRSTVNGGGHGSGGLLAFISRRGATFSGNLDIRNGGNHALDGFGRLTFFTVKPPVNSGTLTGNPAESVIDQIVSWIQLSPSTLVAGPQSY